MTGYIEKMQAVASNIQPPKFLPTSLDAPSTVNILGQLGLHVPSRLTAATATTGNMRASGHRYTVKEIDEALARTAWPIGERLRFKKTLERLGVF